MSLTYGGTTYRSLEEQVRKNMEDISTEAASLAALTEKVDNLQTGGEKVSLTFPAGASSGTVTDEQLATLQENDENYIEMVNDKELYYLNDPGHEEGFLTYSHVGIENSKATIKTQTITVSAKSFVIVTTVVPTDAGGKLYLHAINFGHIDGSDNLQIFAIVYSPDKTEFTFTTFISKNFGYMIVAYIKSAPPKSGALNITGVDTNIMLYGVDNYQTQIDSTTINGFSDTVTEL